ncbi:MAG: alpha/beta fold hydrolase [Gammaproteobacteria bacterium]|jgi:enterochelin esterase-like enzyme
MIRSSFLAATLVWLVAAMTPALGQVATNRPPVVPGARPVTVERIRIHGQALEGNLEGNTVDRDALVLLPPDYAAEAPRRYPVVYALHGYSIGAEQWSQEIHVPQTIEGAFASGAREMIVVLPDSKTAHNGSMYSNSITTGNFEDYVSRDVVAYMDAHYRTIPVRESRGLVGHSMGGYGASRISMKHSDVFGSVYIMSPCCMQPRGPEVPFNTDAELGDALAIEAPGESANLPMGLRAQLAVASAWSPNPNKPPLFLDLPIGEDQDTILGKWAANAVLAFADQYVQQIRRYRAIAIDAGDEDGARGDATLLHEFLDSYGIEHAFEIYPGTHTSNVAFRIQDYVMPFFSEHLSFAQRSQ